MTTTFYIAVAGLMGSGKTTLSRGLASELKWEYVHERTPATLFLEDLFQDPKRWAFETQIAFLVYKVEALRKALSNRTNIVLDRSLEEDIEIFANYFHQHGAIDDRSYNIYSVLAKSFLNSILTPLITIYCSCSPEVAAERIKSSKQRQHFLYPSDHIKQISTMYEAYYSNYDKGLLYQLDTNNIDLRDNKLITEIAEDIKYILEHELFQDYQLDIFNIEAEPVIPSLKHLRCIYRDTQRLSHRYLPSIDLSGDSKITPYPSIYIAAPFTNYSTYVSKDKRGLLDLDLNLNGGKNLITPGTYRNSLLSIEKSCNRIGLNPFLPHRDISRWGHKHLTPSEITELCSKYVNSSDIFLGILGQSIGTHYEFGLALGLKKPCILFKVEELENSYIAMGISTGNRNVIVKDCKQIRDIPGILRTNEIKLFLNNYVPVNME